MHDHNHQHNCHEHNHKHDHDDHSPGRKKIQLAIAALFLLVGIMLRDNFPLRLGLLFVSWLTVGGEVLLHAVKELFCEHEMSEDFLMSIASIGAFAVGEYPEAALVMLLFQLGELLQDLAVGRSRKTITALMDLRPDLVNVLDDSGGTRPAAPETVQPGQLILIRPGERIPLDSVVIDGAADIDTSSLSGESAPRPVQPGDQLISGCVNLNGLLTACVIHAYGDSAVSRILALTESAAERKAKSENFIDRFARVYTPAVVIAAVLLAVLPPLLFSQPWSIWLYRACTLLVVACPCALVISVPLAFFAGMGGAGKQGVLVKGGNYLEALSRTGLALFDKTGTLTEGSFTVTAILPADGHTEAELLRLAAHAEFHSPHPIARSLAAAYGAADPALIASARELPGYGLEARVEGKLVLAGNAALMQQRGVEMAELEAPGSLVHVAADGEYIGCIVVGDTLKEGAATAIAELKAMGIRTAMLSGDRKASAERVGSELALDEVYAELLPQDKVAQAELALSGLDDGAKLAYIGDGVNDAPVLARADIGVAMGGLGSDAAIEAADIVIMNDDPRRLPQAIRHARKVMSIVRQNIVFSLGVKAVILILGAIGVANMWLAVFADVGVALLAIANSLRCLR